MSQVRPRSASVGKTAVLSKSGADDVKQDEKKSIATGQNWVSGGIDDNPCFLLLIILAPLTSLLLSYVTSESMKSSGVQPHLSTLLPTCLGNLRGCGAGVLGAALSIAPTLDAAKFLLAFMGVALCLEALPGKVETGPETLTGHVPKYVDNGVRHCVVFSLLFLAGSNLGVANLYNFGIIYDVFPGAIWILNMFGILLCICLTLKGLMFPSTADSGTTGSFIKDYVWGTELYPRILGLDIKRFINCRFAMTFWQLAGLSFAYKSYALHGEVDYGLLFSAVSQYLYLFKFFWWEMGYMRSIDIIVDRAGFTIQWGCLVYVPSVYTLHTRFSVQNPSKLSWPVALGLFVISVIGVALNYLADRERDIFRATNGTALVWGKEPKFIKAEYTVIDRKTGKETKKTSLLLASGFWGIARHLQYLFELTAAWSWCLLSNPFVNGAIPMYYSTFLTFLLVDRANRDSRKCHLKYKKHYELYCAMVPWKIIPGIY